MTILDALKHVLDGINTYAPTIQAVVVIVALGYGAAQVRQIAQQTKLSMITSRVLHLRDVNELMIQHPALADLLDENEPHAFASILLTTFMLWFALWKAGLVDPLEWQANKRTMATVMARPFMVQHWHAEGTREQWDPDFVRIIDPLVPKAPHPDK